MSEFRTTGRSCSSGYITALLNEEVAYGSTNPNKMRDYDIHYQRHKVYNTLINKDLH
eukprot:c15262_g2_i1 orf=1-168(-)